MLPKTTCYLQNLLVHINNQKKVKSNEAYRSYRIKVLVFIKEILPFSQIRAVFL